LRESKNYCVTNARETGSVGEEEGRWARSIKITKEWGKIVKGKEKNVQESKFQIAVDLGLECDLDIEIEVEPQPERVALATVFLPLLLDSIARDPAESPRGRVDKPARRVLDIVKSEVVERSLTASPLALVTLPLRLGLVILGLFAFRLVHLLLASGLLFLGTASRRHCGNVWRKVCKYDG